MMLNRNASACNKLSDIVSSILSQTLKRLSISGIILKKEFEKSRKYLKWFLLKNYNDIRLLSVGGVQPNLNSTIIKKTKIRRGIQHFTRVGYPLSIITFFHLFFMQNVK